MNTKCECVLAIGLGLCARVSLGHDRPVHFAITLNAAASAFDDSPDYAYFIGAISSDCDRPTATKSLAWGSWLEDNIDVERDLGGKRSMNHFYDPLTLLGLSNIPPDDRTRTP